MKTLLILLLEKNDENYESDNYSAGYNQACSEWKEFILYEIEGHDRIILWEKVNNLILKLTEDVI